MAIFWGVFWGAVLGTFWPGSGDLGMYVGGILGLFAGLTLRFVISKQVSESNATLHKQLLAKMAAVEKNAAAVAKSEASAPRATPLQAPAATLQPAHPVMPLAAASTATTSVAASTPVAAQTADTEAAEDKAFWQDELQRSAAASAKPAAQLLSTSAVNRPSPTVAKAALKPREPDVLEQAFSAVKNWFLGGNTIVRVGLVILFIGLSFLARYAVAAGLLPIELRLAVIGAFGVALLAIGFNKRTVKPAFALALQGAGVAVMYLTVFAAFRLYDMLPALAAFGLMIVVCALSCALALLQNSRALAVAAFAGGFAVPILLSTGRGSHVGLFSYYSLLNLAIMFIAYQRSWRILNIVGFVATFGVAIMWGALKFVPEFYASTQPFLIGFLLIYVITAILYARKTPTQLGNAVDSTLVFGTPLIAFGLQVGLTQQFELGSAFSALGFGALYVVLATVLSRRATQGFRLLIECFTALGVGFITLAVPLGLDAQWTSAVWALEGAAAFWVGMRQVRWMPRAFGLLLQAVAAAAFVTRVGGNVSALPFLNPSFMGAMLIALPALLMAWWLRKPLPHSESRWAKAYAAGEAPLSNPVYLYGFVFWCVAFVLETGRVVPGLEQGVFTPVFDSSNSLMLSMVSIIVNAVLSMLWGLRHNWAVATWPSRVMLIVLVVFGLVVQAGPLWLFVLSLNYWMLYKNDQLAARNNTRPLWSHWVHVGSMWLITWLLARYLWQWIGEAQLWDTSWASVVLLVSTIGVLMLLTVWAGRANRQERLQAFKWPLNPHASAYYWHAAVPLAAMVFLGALGVAVYSSGRTDPLPYIPLLNPTDLSIALAIGALLFWQRAVAAAVPLPAGSAALRNPQAWVALAVLAFIAVNTVWLRVAHHFFGVAWDASSLFGSFVVQTGYAILWTLLALSLMVIAGGRKLRVLWLAGAGLLGLVVVKLLLIDLSNVGGAERIITFIAVGVLMLVVGYFAPLPPKAKVDASADTADAVTKETA
jgi:uncharacterized membrane protein